MKNDKKIYIGSDHAGFKLKEKIKGFLTDLGYQYEDLGPKKYEAGDDYPDYASIVAKQTAKADSRGILICSSGVGMCIAANKIKGIRAVNAYNIEIAKKSREHNDTNILCIGQDYIDTELAKEIIKVWLETDFSAEEKHHRRVQKIIDLEEKGK
ncbi:MAG: ribose 5-phosphate isomerase B [Actinobacteria bacterium]|nr:ribose 5-phosphate isomerase B [Actinomycetota bacterium]